MQTSILIVIALVGLVVYGFVYMKNNKENVVLPEEIQINNNEPEADQTASDTNIKMEQIAKSGDTVSMNYTGRLENGTVFDSNVDPKFNHVEPFVFTLGAGQVIAGWDEGIVGMKVGEKKTLTISPDKGYGARAVGPIPANSTLIFDVELVAIK